MAAYLEDWVRDMPRMSADFEAAGIALADLIHGYVLEDFMASFMGKEAGGACHWRYSWACRCTPTQQA